MLFLINALSMADVTNLNAVPIETDKQPAINLPSDNNETSESSEKPVNNMTIADLMNIMESIRKAKQGQYHDNVIRAAHDKGWSDSVVTQTIESAIQNGVITDKTTNGRVQYKIKKKGVSVADYVENAETQTENVDELLTNVENIPDEANVSAEEL